MLKGMIFDSNSKPQTHWLILAMKASVMPQKNNKKYVNIEYFQFKIYKNNNEKEIAEKNMQHMTALLVLYLSIILTAIIPPSISAIANGILMYRHFSSF